MKEIKAKGRNVVNEKTLIVTVDIGKTTNTGYCRCPDKTEVKPFEFRNGYSGFQKFADVIFKTKDAKGLGVTGVTVEKLPPKFDESYSTSLDKWQDKTRYF